MTSPEVSDEFIYYRTVEPYTPRWEIVWISPELPYFTFMQLCLLDNEMFTTCGYPFDRFQNALEFLKSIDRDSQVVDEQICIFCTGHFSRELGHPEERESDGEVKKHRIEYSIPHVVVHDDDYQGEREINIFTSLIEALDLTTSAADIARPGLHGGYSGENVLGSVYLKTTSGGSIWESQHSGNSIDINFFQDCECDGGLAINSMAMLWDTVVSVGAIPESVKNIYELDDALYENESYLDENPDLAIMFW